MNEHDKDIVLADGESVVDGAVDEVKEFAETAGDKIEEVVAAGKEKAADLVEDAKDLAASAQDKAEDAWESVKEKAADVADDVDEALDDFIDKIDGVPAAATAAVAAPEPVAPVAPVAPAIAPLPPSAPAPAAVAAGADVLEGTEKLLLILGSLFLSVVVPFIVWFLWKDQYPNKAREALKIGIIVALIPIFFICCMMLWVIPVMFSGAMSY